MDATGRWSDQGIGVVKSMEEKNSIRAQKPQALNCPRCNSSHTKFCYYNNYNLSQPRYFCKTCRRYWTAGGSLRNVPVGGGSRKTKRSTSSSKINHHGLMTMTQRPSSSLSNLGSQNPDPHIIQNTHGDQDHLVGIFKSGNDYARGMMIMNSFMPIPVLGSSNTMIMTSTCPDGFENDGGYDDQNNGVIRAVSTTSTAPSTSARHFFPLEDLKPPSASTSDNEVQGDSNCNAYWIGGGSW